MSHPRRSLRWQALGILVALLVVNLPAGLPAAQAAPPRRIEIHRTAAPESGAASQAQGQEFIQRVVDLTNQERAKRGLAPLALDAALNRSAQAHSEDMASHSFFGHTGSNGSDVGQRIAAAGYGPLYAYGENIAAGQPSAEEAVNAWMNSESHRSNILSPYYQHVGVAYAFNQDATYGHYWTQDFGSHGPNPAPPPPTAVPPTAAPPPTRVAPTPVPRPSPTALPPTPTPPAPTALPPTPTPPAPTATPVPRTATPIAPTATPEAPLPSSIALSLIQRVVDLTNQQRAEAGLPALILDPALCNAAQAHSDDMASHDFFGHTGSDGSTLVQRLTAAAYGPIYFCGENIAAGQPSPEEVIDAWMRSPSHRENILSPNYHQIGVGYAYSQDSTYGHYWTQDLGSHSATRPTSVPTPPAPPPGGWRTFTFLPLLTLYVIG